MAREQADANHEFALEMYRSLRAEVLGRIHENHNLWIWKLASVGAVLSFALAESITAGPYVVAIAPFIALAFDALIANNLAIMKSLGQYISTNIEPRYAVSDVGGWEAASVKTRHFGTRKRLWINDWLVINLSSLCVWTGAIILYAVDGRPPDGPNIMMLVSGLLLIYHARVSWNKLCSPPPRPDEP